MNILNLVARWFCKNEAELMLGVGIAGCATSIGLGMRAAVVAKEKKETLKDQIGPNVTKKDIIKTVWKSYIPTAVVFTLSSACLVCSYRANRTRNAVLASALAASEAVMNEYQKQVVEKIGSDAEKEIRNRVNDNQIKKVEEATGINLMYTDGEEYNVFESTTQQHFRSSREQIRRIVNDLNQDRLTGIGGTVSLNDFYAAVGLEVTTAGDSLGWTIDEPIEVDYSAIIHDGIPCLYIIPRNWGPI